MTHRTMTSLLALTVAVAAATPCVSQPPAPAAAPAPVPSPPSRPNILVWMMDDVGFAQVHAFAGLVETPNIDRIAQAGLRYANYHTEAICSSSRASFLTGRNSHSVHMGGHALASRPLPGYDAKVPAEDGTIAANLHAAGYTTFALGKWDHLPSMEMTTAGPFTHWPTGQGFDSWYGFLAAETDNWHPVLMRNTTPIATPDKPDYHLSHDLADQAITMIDSRASSVKPAPFFMYFATGAAHAPHHAPRDWIEHYKGRFDIGWDKAREEILENEIQQGLVPAGTKLAPRPPSMPAWDTLSADQKKLYARQMEVFAASLSYADAQFGRVLDHLKQTGELDNTIVVITSDNGASAEGGPDGLYSELALVGGGTITTKDNLKFYDKWGGPETFPHYSFGWAVAGNTPFRYYKQTTHEGGIHVPFVISWPKNIAAHGEIRHQFVDVEDVAPTLLELAGVPLAQTINNTTQAPMEGTSFAYSLTDPNAPGRKDAQYFEMYGNKALWSKDWTINTTHRLVTWNLKPLTTPPNEPWELYNLANDPGQTTNLAAQYPDRVSAMSALFDQQAKQFHVYPIGNMTDAWAYGLHVAETNYEQRGGKWVFPGPVWHISEVQAPPITHRPFHMSALLNLPTGHENGPIYAQGSAAGGTALYLKSGVPAFILRSYDGSSIVLSAPAALPRGTTSLELDIDHKSAPPGTQQDITISLAANGKPLASKTVKTAMPAFSIAEAFDIGTDFGGAVSDTYKAGVPFSGTIGQVVFDFNRARQF